MNSTLVLLAVPLQDLLDQVREIIKSEVSANQKAELEEKLLSPKEACKLFQPTISLVTLAKWTKDGRIQEHRIGGRVYYKYTEVINSLQTLKKYKKG